MRQLVRPGCPPNSPIPKTPGSWLSASACGSRRPATRPSRPAACVRDELLWPDSGRSRRRLGGRAQGRSLGFWAPARTFAVGAACGAITVLGLVGASQVKVATLRTDT
jgi:hypothetical protein